MTCDSPRAMANADQSSLIRRLECRGFALAQRMPLPSCPTAASGLPFAVPLSPMNPAALPVAWMPAVPAASAADASGAAAAPGWNLQRRCALAPAQLGVCLAVLVAASGLVGLGFWAAGVPFVTAFAGLELLAVLVAFTLHARHAADGESLRLHGGRLHVEFRRGGRTDTVAFDLWSLRLSAAADDVIVLHAFGRTWPVGRLADPPRRRRVLQELRDAVADAQRARTE